MKKSFIIISIFLLLLIFPIAIAQQTEVDKAVQCLKDKINDKTCDSLSTEEKIFSLLAVQDCDTQLSADSKANECWPKSNCNIKTTAQAILALDSVGTSTTTAQTWLLSQTTTPSDILWYLQIDSNEQTSCTVSYSGSSHSIIIGEDKKINSHAGDCLRLANSDYWLRIPSTCFDEDFSITCDNSFKTNLIFKEVNSPTFYISEKTSSGSAQSSITQSINSKCFSTSELCDYEGTLWAAITLSKLKKDASLYIPYLITEAKTNQRYLPESFLYLLAGDSYYNDLISKQKNNQYWDESGDKLYDTALALYPLQADTSPVKIDSINWLLDNQKSDGCWDNIRNTGFILYSVWPTKTSNDCEDTGGFCIPELDCDEGNILDKDCVSGVCCSKQTSLESCSVQNGEICLSGKKCQGDEVKASDDDKCCLGKCVIPTPAEKSECEQEGGTCKVSCGDDEEKAYECDYYSDVCCFGKKGNYWYIWVLSVLIVLIIAAIIFRDKLKDFGSKFISKFGKPSQPPATFPESPQSQPLISRGIPRRRIFPHAPQRRPARPAPPTKRREELDEVLKKLKDIGK